MKQRKDWWSLSLVCILQLLVCCGAILAILCWRTVGGDGYDRAKDWYKDTVSDSIIVLPDDTLSSNG